MLYVIGDLHFGLRRNNKMFHDILMKEVNWILKTITKKDSIVLLGDIFDSRSSVDFRILNDAWDFFIKLSRSCKEIFILTGNHDLYYRENKEDYVNYRFLHFDPSADSKIAPVHIVSDITEAKICGKKCLFLPWIDSIEMKNSAIDSMMECYDIIFGHFDVMGLYGAHVVDERTMFADEDFPDDCLILSGHYHCRKDLGKVKYVGSLINSTFNDVGYTKGIHKINSKNEVQFIEGSSPQFEYITIDDPSKFVEAFEKADENTLNQLKSKIEGNIIKLIMNEYGKDNDKVFKFIKGMTPLELTIGYNRVSFDNGVDGEEFEGFDAKADLQMIITKYIDKVQDNLPDSINPDDIKRLVSTKFNEYKIDQQAI